MALGRAWRWCVDDFRRGLADHDPSKLMAAPILFAALMAVLDRAIYEVARDAGRAPSRITRLSSLPPPAPGGTLPARFAAAAAPMRPA